MSIVGKPPGAADQITANSAPVDFHQASTRLAAIIECSDDAIVTKQLDGTITSWNAAASRIFGYLPEEIIGKSIFTIIPPELHAEEHEVLRKLSRGERIHHYETTRIAKDGSRREVSLTISPLKDENGVVIGASKIARDITDRRRGDEARRRLAAIVDFSDDAIISKDLDGFITTWNRAAERLFGWKAEEIIGRSVLTIIPPELQHEEPGILAKLRSGDRIDHFETQRLHKDGHRLEVSLAVSPIKDESGNVIGASKIARDISDRKRMQRALIDSEKLAATGRMAAAIAHELNNPLEAVTNLAYLLSIDSGLNPTARRYAEMMLDEISRASHITKQTLAFYRDTRNPVPFRICDLLDNILELNRPVLVAKQIQIRREYESSEPVFGYAAEVRQVFANLILNAVDAALDNGTISIRISNDPTQPTDRRLRVSIADSGSGIPKSARPRLFHPFFTTKGSRGNGLGLWVSRGIVEKHGGKIRVRSRTEAPKRGTVFSVLLPLSGVRGAGQAA